MVTSDFLAVFTGYNVAFVAAGNATTKVYSTGLYLPLCCVFLFYLMAHRSGAIPKRYGVIASNAQV